MKCAPRSLCAYSAERIFIISRLSRSAERSKRIFTGGVVTENGICSAAFCESAALRLASSPSQSPTVTALPKGEPLAVPANFIFLPRPLPLGEVDLRSKDGEGEDACGVHPQFFPLPCNDTPRSTVCSTGKVSEFCPAAEGRKADRMPVLGRQSCAFCRF